MNGLALVYIQTGFPTKTKYKLNSYSRLATLNTDPVEPRNMWMFLQNLPEWHTFWGDIFWRDYRKLPYITTPNTQQQISGS